MTHNPLSGPGKPAGDTDIFTPPHGFVRWAHVVPNVQNVTMPRCGLFAKIERPEQVKQLLGGPRSHLEIPDGEVARTPMQVPPDLKRPRRMDTFR